ncbi:hypothetical protein TVAG_202920 [Trichomonas vaginalis G3]|uniref:TPR Domain containing protein n=1 Tax=Trichomonas vaginalis (strain ATCC PRA-98 / G3) TaxID=412133 RepID=A2ENG4_TRIV3|nr:HCP-like family [Trichomonas vaginalis G3]EAY05834.1 hypothetical protein TVAG_202920 [Trichomonas vaginalis G3]KAI5516384.1 HCP-like family [Trichomonas vaginalis G3]|eukprot:XP_001318057.1 hypothetical protein [Trichomonas vaginalis G3]
MIIPPSPQLLLHVDDQFYGQQIFRKEPSILPSEELRKQRDSFIFVDLGLMCLNGQNPRVRKSIKQTLTLLSAFFEIPNPGIPLFFGVLSNALGNIPSSLYFFQLAAQRGSTIAMNAIGVLYQRYSASIPDQTVNTFQEALKWHKRAQKSGSLDALSHLGDLFYSNSDKIKALHYYLQHFKATHSISSAKKCAAIFKKQKQFEASKQMLKLAAAQGDKESVLDMIDILQNENDSYEYKLWESIRIQYNIQIPQPQTFSHLMSASRHRDIGLPPFAAAANILSLGDPFGQIDNTQRLLQNLTTLTFCHDDTPNFPTDPSFVEKPSPAFYPSTNRTRLLLLAFQYTSANFSERNLNLASLALKTLNEISPKGICESKLWQSKYKYPRDTDYAIIGFISYILDDFKSALEFFEAGAKKGCRTCALMAGIMLFHGIGFQAKPDFACYYFAQCPTDPLSLLHLGTSCDDEIWLTRAAKFLGLPADSGRVFEWAGDAFMEGTKVPQNRQIAQMWYGLAYSKYKKGNEDMSEFLTKVKEVATL